MLFRYLYAPDENKHSVNRSRSLRLSTIGSNTRIVCAVHASTWCSARGPAHAQQINHAVCTTGSFVCVGFVGPLISCLRRGRMKYWNLDGARVCVFSNRQRVRIKYQLKISIIPPDETTKTAFLD